MTETRLKFSIVLRREGFSREWRAVDCTQHKKELHDRTLHVQLWTDGKHRCSFDVKGHGWTLPTCFETIDGMMNAIAIQTGLSALPDSRQ